MGSDFTFTSFSSSLFHFQISKLQKDKILRMIKKGEEQGCKIQCGGKAVEEEEGHFIQPTVLTDLTDDMEISQQEVVYCSLPSRILSKRLQ